MSMAFGISEEDIRNAFLNKLGMDITLEAADKLYPRFDHAKIQKSALYGADLEQQTEYAEQEIRDQIVMLGEADDVVGEWVGLHYLEDFPSLSNLRQIEFRERWIEMHSPQEEQHKPEGMPQNR
jgi:hypothetical protein